MVIAGFIPKENSGASSLDDLEYFQGFSSLGSAIYFHVTTVSPFSLCTIHPLPGNWLFLQSRIQDAQLYYQHRLAHGEKLPFHLIPEVQTVFLNCSLNLRFLLREVATWGLPNLETALHVLSSVYLPGYLFTITLSLGLCLETSNKKGF